MVRTLVFAICAIALGSPAARAATITWFASNEVLSVSPLGEFFWPGLTAGTPWSLTVSFDPAAAPVRTITPGCNIYAIGSSTLTVGPYAYTHSSGQIFTNAGLPEVGCVGGLPEGEAGLIQFWYGSAGWESEDPGAWDLGMMGGITYAGYYDLLVTDGTLPMIPTFNPVQGRFAGMEIESEVGLGLRGGAARFSVLDEPPSPVPEPASLTLFGAGLAALLARRRMLK